MERLDRVNSVYCLADTQAGEQEGTRRQHCLDTGYSFEVFRYIQRYLNNNIYSKMFS